MPARPSRLIAVAIAACWTALPGGHARAGLLVGEARHVDVKAPSNVLSTSASNEFNIGSQLPGVAIPVTFNAIGEVPICAIHPRIRMVVNGFN